MFFKTCATLALATGFAAAKPIAPRTPANNNLAFGGGKGQGFSFIDGFNNFNNQQQVIQIQEQNLQIVDNGFQQAVVQQASEVLIVNEQQNGFNNQLNNLFRKSNFRNNFQDQSTVMLVVQEIQIAVDNGIGGQFQQQVFAQSAVVANRGLAATQTIMVFQQETLIAQNVLGGVGGFQNFQNNILGQGKNNNVANLPTRTADVQLFGSKPTWSSVAEDPAATLGGIWEAELEDAQAVDNNQNDNDANNQAAEAEKKALEEAKAAEEAAQQEGEQQAQEGEENQDEQNNEEEQQAQEGEEAQEGEQNQEEQAAQEGEQAAQEGEQAAQEGEEAAAEGEKL